MSSSIEKAPSSPRRSTAEAPKRPSPESVLDAKKRDLEKTIGAASALMDEIQQKMSRGEELTQADRKSVRSFLQKLHPDTFNGTGLEETAGQFFKEYGQFSASVENRLHEQRTAAEAAQEAEARAEQEKIQQKIAQEQAKEVAAALNDLTKKYRSGETHGSTTKALDAFQKLHDLRKKIEPYTSINLEASELQKLISEFSYALEKSGRGLNSSKGDKTIEARIAKLNFELNPPDAEKNEASPSVILHEEPPEEVNEADFEYVDDPKAEMQRQWRVLQNKEAGLKEKIAEAEKKINMGDRWRQFKQWVKGEPAIGPYYRLNSLKAELEEVQQQLFLFEEDQNMAKIRKEAREEFANNPPSFIKSGKRIARDAVRDAASSFIPFVESSYDIEEKPYKEAHSTLSKEEREQYKKEMEEMMKASRKEKPAKMSNEEMHAIGNEFRARRRAQQPKNEPTAAEVEAKIQADREKYGWQKDNKETEIEIEDEDIISLEDAPKKTPPPTPMERARQDVRANQESRYRELLGNRASEVMGTIDSLFAQMSPAEASKLGFSRDQYLDFASGLMQSATESWKDEKSGYTSDDYFNLALRKLKEYNKKLGLPPDFVTGFGGSRPEKMSGLGGNSARADAAREAGRIAGAPSPERSPIGRRSSGKSEVLDQPVEKAQEPEEFDVDLSDLEKGPLDEQFDARVKETAEAIGREKADAIWKRLNQAIAQNQEKIQALNNYDYLNYRGGTDYVLNRLPNVKDRSLETALTVAIAELVKGTQDRQLEGKVMGTLATLGINREEISAILYPPEKGFSAEKRKGVARTISDRNRRENSRRYGGSTATGM